MHVASLSKSYLGTFGKQPCAVLFIESQQKGQTEVQRNPELPLSIALPVVGFLSTDSMGTCSSTSNQLLDVHEEVFLYAVICCHDTSTDTVTFSIKIRRYECIEVCRKYAEAIEFHGSSTNSLNQALSPPLWAW